MYPLMMISSFVMMAAVFLFVETRPTDVTSRNPLTTTEGSCDPNVDMVFMLNGRASVSHEDFERQKNFVRDTIRTQNTPAGAVRVGLVVCSDRNVTSVPFQKTKTDIMASLDMLQKSHPTSHTSDTTHCIEHIHQMFRDIDKKRQHRSKLALLIIGTESHLSKQNTTLLSKEMEVNRISLLVIGVGIQDFLTLHSLQNIASKSHRLFVLTSYLELQRVSKLFFSTNSCLSISLNLDSEYSTSTATPNTTIGPRKETCRQSEDGPGEYYKQVPFLGWQRRSCKESKIIDVFLCTCVIRKPTTVSLKNSHKSEFLEHKIDLTTLNPEVNFTTLNPEVNKDVDMDMEISTGSNIIFHANNSLINSTAVTMTTSQEELILGQTKSRINETNISLNASNLTSSTIYTTLNISTLILDSEQQHFKFTKPP